MKRKKTRLTKIRKKKSSLAKSDDSGVSLEDRKDNMKKTDDDKQTVDIRRESEITTNNMRISIDLTNIQRFINLDNNESDRVTLGSQILSDDSRGGKGSFSFEDDTQSCLDYEPFEEDLESYVDSPENRSRSPIYPEDVQFPNACMSHNETDNNESMENSSSKVEITEHTDKGYSDVYNNVQENSYNSKSSFEDQVTRTQSTSLWSKDNDEESMNSYSQEECTENASSQEDENDEDTSELFKSASINFKGNLNIVITRPVINNAEPPKTSAPIENTSKQVDNASIPSALDAPCQFTNQCSSETRKWRKIEFDSDLAKITSNDNIFMYNIVDRRIDYGSLDGKKLWSSQSVASSQNHSECSRNLYPDVPEDFFASKFTVQEHPQVETTGSCWESENQYTAPSPDIIQYNSNFLSNQNTVPTQFCENSNDSSWAGEGSLYNPSATDSHTNYSPVVKVLSNEKLLTTQHLSTTSGIPYFVSSDNINNGLHHDNQHAISNQTISSTQPLFKNTNNSSVSSEDSPLKYSLKRPPTRPQKKNEELQVADVPSTREDSISIFAMSSVLGDTSDYSGTSDNDTETGNSDKEEFVSNWINVSKQSKVQQLLELLCESKGCDDYRCTRSHSIVEVTKQIRLLPLQELTEIYKMVKEKNFWYEVLFDVFIECFKALPDVGRVMLIDMINDVFIMFESTFIDKTVYIMKIIEALQSTGMSFKEAMEYIIWRHGTSHLSVCDILLCIISEQPNLENHWCLVQKITLFRREKIDHHVVINLLKAALENYPPNKELCKNIFNDIFEKNLVDLEKIPQKLMACVDLNMKMCITRGNNYETNWKTKNLSTRNNSVLDQNSVLQFDSELCRRPNISQHNSKPSYDTGSSGSSSGELGSLLRIRPGNQEEMYGIPPQLNNKRSFHYQENVDAGRPIREDIIFERPTRINGDSSIHTQMVEIANNRHSIEDQVRPRFLIGNETNGEDSIDVINEESNSYCTQLRSANQHVFKVPMDCAPKKQIRRTNTMLQRSQENERGKQLLNAPSRSIYSNGILKKISDSSRNRVPRSQTPAHIIAHPSCQLQIDPLYECNISLHNLYPKVQVSAIDISTADLHRLREVLENMDGQEFLKILDSYQDSFAIESFIVNTLTLLKTGRGESDIFANFMWLLRAIEKVDPDYKDSPHTKMLIEVLALNLIYLLDMKGEWKLCREILLKVNRWHSLVTSKIFFCKSHMMSHMHRYLFIIGILIRAEDYHWANEMFQCEELNLLKPVWMWPFQHVQTDILARNQVLKLFFEEGLTLNIVSTNDLLKHILVTGSEIEGFDLWKLLDQKLCAMLDAGEENRSILDLLFTHIVNDYAPYMSNHVLHGYLIYMKDKISENDAFSLFRTCCEKGIYHKYTGKERLIVIRTEMSDFEISFLLECFFEGIKNRSVPVHDFCIELKLPKIDEPSSPQILKNRNRSLFAVCVSIQKILKAKFNIEVEQAVESKIFVSKEMQERLFWM